MFLSPYKILKTTLVIGLLLPVCGAANALPQQNRNSARLEMPHVRLLASPTSVAPGRQVRLVAQLSSGYPNLRFRFAFGDGAESGWQTSMVATHTYRAPGNYLPYVDIGVATNAGVTRLGGSPRARILVNQPSPGPVERHVSRATAGTDWPTTSNTRSANNRTRRATVVTSVATTGRRVIAGVRGRRSRRTSSEEKATETSATKADSSPAQAKTSAPSPTPRTSSPVATLSPALATSPVSADTQSVVASEQPGGNWWKYLLLVLPLAFVAFVFGKKYLVSRPTIHTFPDQGTSNVTDASGLVVDSRVNSRPNILHGEHIVSSDDTSLVKNVRREDV